MYRQNKDSSVQCDFERVPAIDAAVLLNRILRSLRSFRAGTNERPEGFLCIQGLNVNEVMSSPVWASRVWSQKNGRVVKNRIARA
jgi:hypothetical protein